MDLVELFVDYLIDWGTDAMLALYRLILYLT